MELPKVNEVVEPLGESVLWSDSIWKAWRILKSESLPYLPVLNERTGKVIGIIESKTFKLASLLENNQLVTAGDLAFEVPMECQGEDSVESVFRKMSSKQKLYAVVRGEGASYKGILSWNRIVNNYWPEQAEAVKAN